MIRVPGLLLIGFLFGTQIGLAARVDTVSVYSAGMQKQLRAGVVLPEG